MVTETSEAAEVDSSCVGELLTTGDMARRSGSTLRTVRFYEEAGLLSPDCRSDGGHRLFGARQLERLRLILDLREAGLSLGDIKTMFGFKHDCASACEASERMTGVLKRQVQELGAKIDTLTRLREDLTSMVSAIQSCAACNRESFPTGCGNCAVMRQDGLPRAMKLLWGRKSSCADHHDSSPGDDDGRDSTGEP